MRCRTCSGHGKVPGDTQRLSEFSYRVLRWLRCWRCEGTGKVVPQPKPKAA